MQSRKFVLPRMLLLGLFCSLMYYLSSYRDRATMRLIRAQLRSALSSLLLISTLRCVRCGIRIFLHTLSLGYESLRFLDADQYGFLPIFSTILWLPLILREFVCGFSIAVRGAEHSPRRFGAREHLACPRSGRC